MQIKVVNTLDFRFFIHTESGDCLITFVPRFNSDSEKICDTSTRIHNRDGETFYMPCYCCVNRYYWENHYETSCKIRNVLEKERIKRVVLASSDPDFRDLLNDREKKEYELVRPTDEILSQFNLGFEKPKVFRGSLG